jgi:superfamily I DNA/RNA helicase
MDHHTLAGPVLLRAAPGTGKTTALAKRVKHLITELATDPDTVSVITFTGSAAAEMRSRISDSSRAETYLPPRHQPRTICTMHSLGYRIVCSAPDRLGLKGSIRVVASDSTCEMLAQDAAQLSGRGRQDAGVTVQCRRSGDCNPDESARCQICGNYQGILRSCNAVDYDDQILLALRVLQEDGAALEEFQSRCRHLLVDEYQDINTGQFRLIELLTTSSRDGLFAVGDDDQSIYAWRGGSPRFVRMFHEDFAPTARVVPLLHCRRCPPCILRAATSVVSACDPDWRSKGDITFEEADDTKVVIHNVPSAQREAEVVASIAREALPAGDMLVLVPGRQFVPLLAGVLERRGYRVSGQGGRPGDGLVLLGHLANWLGDPHDSLALRECLDGMLDAKWSGVPSRSARSPRKTEERERSLKLVSALWGSVLGKGISLWSAVLENRKRDRLLEEAASRLEALLDMDRRAVPDFVRAAVETLSPWNATDQLLREVAEQVTLRTSEGSRSSLDTVRVMTLHSAKGLEADVVCVVGLEEGVFPRSGRSLEELAEDSRLMYVAMTRAKGELHLFHARQRPASVSYRQTDHAGGEHTLRPSPFLECIGEDVAVRQYHR